jgi:hypothetical protein
MTNTNETKTSSGFERLLFHFTRVFALGGSLIAILGVVLLMFSLFGSGERDSLVKLTDLRSAQQAENTTVESPNIEVEIPENVKKYISGENEKVLYKWIESLDEKDQEDFIENLSLIITEAENKGEDVVDVINDYKTAKLSKLQKTEFEKYEKVAERGAIIGAMFGLIIFIALMSLILVMLAIERNTRNTTNS